MKDIHIENTEFETVSYTQAFKDLRPGNCFYFLSPVFAIWCRSGFPKIGQPGQKGTR